MKQFETHKDEAERTSSWVRYTTTCKYASPGGKKRAPTRTSLVYHARSHAPFYNSGTTLYNSGKTRYITGLA